MIFLLMISILMIKKGISRYNESTSVSYFNRNDGTIFYFNEIMFFLVYIYILLCFFSHNLLAQINIKNMKKNAD